MKLLAATALVGAAAAISPQEVLKSPVDALTGSLKGMTADVKAVWDEVSMMFPEEMKAAKFFSSPKPHVRRPDSKWDHIVKGADVQSVWIENEDGVKERRIEGDLEQYNLRAKSVNPKKLGVDTVKQYSGYLDDEANDKHLFYCKLPHYLEATNADMRRVLRVEKRPKERSSRPLAQRRSRLLISYRAIP